MADVSQILVFFSRRTRAKPMIGVSLLTFFLFLFFGEVAGGGGGWGYGLG